MRLLPLLVAAGVCAYLTTAAAPCVPWPGASAGDPRPTLLIGHDSFAISGAAAAVAAALIGGSLRYPVSLCAVGDGGVAADMLANASLHAAVGALPGALPTGAAGVGLLGPRAGYEFVVPAWLAAGRPTLTSWLGFAPPLGSAAPVGGRVLLARRPTGAAAGAPDPTAVCGAGPTSLAAANISAACLLEPSEVALYSDCAALDANGTGSLALVQTPSYGTAARNISRVRMPPCCEYGRVPVSVAVWAELFAFFPPSVSAVLRSLRLSDADADALLRGGGPGANTSAGARAWLATAAGAAAQGAWMRVLQVSTVTPSAGPTSGGTPLVLRGTGFGRVRPLALTVAVGGAPCTNATWLSDTSVACVSPPGLGLQNSVRVPLFIYIYVM